MARLRSARPASSVFAPRWQAFLIFILVLLVTSPTIRNGFVTLDDPLYIGNPNVVNGLTPAGAAFAFRSVSDLYWHPLTWLSHEMDVSVFGLDPAGHHLTNALLHALAAALLYLLIRQIGAGAWTSPAGSLFWALHPLRVESFAWVAERKDVLCAVFFLATPVAYVTCAASPSRRGYLIWNLLGVLALMAKPSAVCIVPILLLLDYWPLQRSGRSRLLEKLPLAAMSTVVACLTVYGQRKSGSMSYLVNVPAWTRVENAAIFYWRYIGKVLWPVNLGCFYSYGPPPELLEAISAVLVLAAITWAAIALRRRQPWLLVSWIWFLIALLPNLGLFQAGRQSIADRFTHLATIGVSVGVACCLGKLAGPSAPGRKVAAIMTGAVLIALSLLTVRQVGFWHDSNALFEHAIGVEDSDYMRSNLATVLISQGRYAEAQTHLAAAVRLSPQVSAYHSDLANVLLRTGQPAEARTEAATALRLKPDSISAAETMGLILFRDGDSRGALAQFNRALELGAPSQPMASELNDMAASLASRGSPQGAEPMLRRALDLNPRLVQGWRNLALVLQDQHRADEVFEVLRQAIAATGPQAAYADLTPSAAGR